MYLVKMYIWRSSKSYIWAIVRGDRRVMDCDLFGVYGPLPLEDRARLWDEMGKVVGSAGRWH